MDGNSHVIDPARADWERLLCRGSYIIPVLVRGKNSRSLIPLFTRGSQSAACVQGYIGLWRIGPFNEGYKPISLNQKLDDETEMELGEVLEREAMLNEAVELED